MFHSRAGHRLLRLLFVTAGLAATGQAAAQCISDVRAACLADGRFRAEITWWEAHFAPDGAPGHAIGLSDNTAAFWFFQPSNLELVFKVLDGRTVNGRFWFFGAAMTTLEFSLQITDTAMGWRRVWSHPTSAASTEVDIGAFSDDPLEGAVLFIGAHPDDEAHAAPILGNLCVEKRRRCAFLDVTRGEAGQCRLSGGCHPDLGTVRSAEMQNAAALFGAALTQWSLPDIPGPDVATVRSAWAAASGGDGALVQRIAGAIAAVSPDTLITFDPRHGSTCHPAHRALGQLVREALATLPAQKPATYLLETFVRSVANQSDFQFSRVAPEDFRGFAFDGNLPRADRVGKTAWDFLLDDVRVHPSQFDASALASLAAVPNSEREVRLLPLWAFDGFPGYEGLCDAVTPASAAGESVAEPQQMPMSAPDPRPPRESGR